jgi:hypothetical protein
MSGSIAALTSVFQISRCGIRRLFPAWRSSDRSSFRSMSATVSAVGSPSIARLTLVGRPSPVVNRKSWIRAST